MEITIEQARAKAYEWRGEAGGEVLPPLTANELAGLINEHVRELLGEPVGIVARSPMAATVGWTCDLLGIFKETTWLNLHCTDMTCLAK